MPTINGRACVVNGTPVDKVFIDGKQVYGRNLLLRTSNINDYTLSGSGWAAGGQSSNGGTVSISATPGEYYTYSAVVKSTTFNCYLQTNFYDNSKNLISRFTSRMGTDIGMRTFTTVAPENVAYMNVYMVFNNPPDSQTAVFNSEKLEQGTTATPWTPAPEDVM